MNNPDVILRVDRHTRNCPNQPVIRQRLRPKRINFERRNMVDVLWHKELRRQQQKYTEVLHLHILRRLLREVHAWFPAALRFATDELLMTQPLPKLRSS